MLSKMSAALAALALVTLSASVVQTVQAASVRVANQGDVLSLDPHSLNEAVQLAFLNNVYESLVTRDKTLKLIPSLATEWKLKTPTIWVFDLRKGVKFHDGSAFSADDVVFSLNRARGDGSDVRGQLASIKDVRKSAEFQIEVETTDPNPILPDVITNILVMSKAWCESNQAVKPVDRRKGIENAASFRANGTGPYRVRERQPGIKTVLAKNGQWWNKVEGNIDEVTFIPIATDATRLAALLTKEVDVIDPVPLQDLQRIRSTPGFAVQQAPESRIIFLGFDQQRDELLYSSVKGKNPFKDQRVRQAFYQAIDVDTISARVMRGLAKPTGAMVTEGIRGYSKEMDQRLPYSPDASKKLLVEAGYPDGFELTMNCPNDRYVNDSEICQAVAANLARVGIRIRLAAESKTTYFPRALKRDVSFFMLGWSPAGYDSHNLLFTVLSSPAGAQGQWNFGAYSNPQLDALTKKIQTETNAVTRDDLIKQALKIHANDVGHIPLHQQVITWAMRDTIKAYQRADGFMLFKWMTVSK